MENENLDLLAVAGIPYFPPTVYGLINAPLRSFTESQEIDYLLSLSPLSPLSFSSHKYV